MEKVVAEIFNQVANVSIIKKVAEKVEVVKMEETVIIAVVLVMTDVVVNLNYLKSLKRNFSLSFFYSLFLNNYLNNVYKSIVSYVFITFCFTIIKMEYFIRFNYI